MFGSGAVICTLKNTSKVDVVFTVPEELNPIIYSNQKFLYAALYHAASDTLSELAAYSKYLGTCLLYTSQNVPRKISGGTKEAVGRG